MSKITGVFMWLLMISVQLSYALMPKIPSPDWDNVFKCLDHSTEFYVVKRKVESSTRMSSICSIAGNSLVVPHRKLYSLVSLRTTTLWKLDSVGVSKHISSQHLINVWQCMNERCGNVDGCTTICPQTTPIGATISEDLAKCYKGKVTFAKVKMRKCFETEAREFH